MRWLADECAAASLVAALRENGHDVIYIAEVAPRASDAEVLRLARDEARLLLTDDKDFGDLVFRQNWPVAGVVLLRLGPAMAERRWDRLQAAIDPDASGQGPAQDDDIYTGTHRGDRLDYTAPAIRCRPTA